MSVEHLNRKSSSAMMFNDDNDDNGGKRIVKVARERVSQKIGAPVPMFHSSSNILCIGRTQAGKTMLTLNIIKQMHWLFDVPPQKVLWCYGQHQDLIFKELRDYPVEFHFGIPDFDAYDIDTKIPKLLILDDLLTSVNKDVEKVFLYQSHHLNFSTIFLSQNLFYSVSPIWPVISRNAHYIILFPSARDNQQFSTLARQIDPKNYKFLESVYNEISEQPYGYIFLDLHPKTPKNIQVRSDILNKSGCTVYYDPLRYGSNETQSTIEPSTVDIPVQELLSMDTAEQKCASLKRILKIVKSKSKPDLYFKIDASNDEIILLKECCVNIMKQNVKLTDQEYVNVKRHRAFVKAIGSDSKLNRLIIIKSRKLIASNVSALPHIIPPSLRHLNCM